MATKHLVPSKDALRLLRQLASAPYHPLQYDDAVSSKKPQSRQCAAKERYAARPSCPIGICRHQYSLARIIQPREYHNNQLYNRHRHVRLYVTAAEALLNVQEEESEADHSFAPIHQDFENPQLGQILIDDHEILLERILAVRHTDGDFAAKSLLEEMLISYMSTNEPKHAQIAETLFLTVRQHSTGIDLGSVQYVALTALLEKYRSATRAASLLFWDLSTTHVRHYRHHIRRTASYLKQLCKHNHESPIFFLDHTLKLLQSVQLCGFPISADITFPVIQSAVAAGLIARAHRFFSAVQHDYGFDDVFPSILELTRGYARTHDWSAVDNLLEDLHRQGYPRSKPFAFASLVEGTLTLFIPHYGDSRFYDYLIYCIQEHGLVPTPELARLIYVSCVRAQRPDLAQKWTKDLLTAWPTMLSTARIPQTAHDIAVAWAATTASCVDILNTCIAFAYGSVRSPFSDDFKNLAKEALMHDLARRGQRYQDTYDIQVTDQDSWNPDKFHTPQAFFEHVEALLHRDLGQRGKLVRTLSKTELIKHFVAARQTVLLLDDFDTYVATYGPRFEVELQINENLSSATRRKRQMKQNQARKWSSIDTFPAFHAAIKRECKEIDGSSATRAIILKQVLEVLQSEWRYSDIAGLLLKYSRLRSAAETFDEEIFTYWLVAARGIQGEGEEVLADALWALVRSPPSLVLSDRFLLLLRLTVNSLGSHRRRQSRRGTSLAERAELEYLQGRIYRRKWYQKGCPTAEQIAEPHLRTWKQLNDLRPDRYAPIGGRRTRIIKIRAHFKTGLVPLRWRLCRGNGGKVPRPQSIKTPLSKGPVRMCYSKPVKAYVHHRRPQLGLPTRPVNKELSYRKIESARIRRLNSGRTKPDRLKSKAKTKRKTKTKIRGKQGVSKRILPSLRSGTQCE